METPVFYELIEQYVSLDSDGWQHWISEKHISYHTTFENAHKALEQMLHNKIKRLMCDEFVNMNPHIPVDWFEYEFLRIQSNSLPYNGEDNDIYFICQCAFDD